MVVKDTLYAEPLDYVDDFAFDEQVAAVFDDMVSRSVPFYCEAQRMLAELASRFAKPNTEVVDLGCSTGTTLALMQSRIADPSVRFIGIDNSKEMLAKAEEKLAASGRVGTYTLHQEDLHGAFSLGAASVVTMNWTLQFVRPIYRESLLRHVHDHLVEDGCFLLCEKVVTDDPQTNRLYIDLYYDYKRRVGYSDTEIAQKREALENVLIPYRMEENHALLRRAGFTLVDTFFRWYNWAGVIAVKKGA